MSSSNYQSVIEQIHALGEFGADSYKSGQLDRKHREAIRKEIFGFLSRVNNSADGEKITLSNSMDESRSILDTYIHDFGNPKHVPNVHFDYIDTIGGLLKAVDVYQRSELIELGNDDEFMLEGISLSNTISVLADEWISVTSKILRLAFQVREPPLQLPNTKTLEPGEEKSVFEKK